MAKVNLNNYNIYIPKKNIAGRVPLAIVPPNSLYITSGIDCRMQVWYDPGGMKPNGLNGRRSDCPVNFAVEALGDKWSLVILRDMIFWGKKTYGEFLKSDEHIATNILADRLAYLEREGLVTKSRDPNDKRKDIYRVTEKAIGLVPMFIEMIAWSAQEPTWQTMTHNGTPAQVKFVTRCVTTKNKSRLIEEVKEIVRRGGCVFEGVVREPLPV